MSKISNENNFLYLFAALVLLLFSTALLPLVQTPWLNDIIEAILFLVFLLGVHSLKNDRSWMWAVYFMVFVMAVLFMMRTMFADKAITQYLNLAILLFFFIGSFSLSVKQIVMSREVDQNMIVGSIVLYLLLGLIWTVLYLLLLSIYPDAFNGIDPLSWQKDFSRVAYYSFVTLTTLGYGDISPRNSVAEFFVYSEAIVGVFYMAIIVSSLVSARLESRGRR